MTRSREKASSTSSSAKPGSLNRNLQRARPPTAAGQMNGRRLALLQMAAKRFAELGFEATTIREIADDAGILSGSIYHYFDSKDGILHELIRDPLRSLRDDTLRIAASDCDAEHKMVALILLSMRKMIDDPYVQAILYNERKLFRNRADFGYVADAKQNIYQIWGAVLRDGVSAELFRSGSDTFLTISTTVRLLNTCADWFRHEDDIDFSSSPHYDFDRVVRFNLEFIMAAIRHPRRIGEPIPQAVGKSLIEAR